MLDGTMTRTMERSDLPPPADALPMVNRRRRGILGGAVLMAVGLTYLLPALGVPNATSYLFLALGGAFAIAYWQGLNPYVYLVPAATLISFGTGLLIPGWLGLPKETIAPIFLASLAVGLVGVFVIRPNRRWPLVSGRRSYDLRALSSAFGLMVLLALALVGAAVDALVTAALASAREAARIRVRFGPAAPVLVAAPLPITDDLLLDKRGRPLRGAARTKRIASIERERALLRPVFVAPAVRVLELPARLDPRALRIPRLPVPSIPVRSLPVRWVRIVAITTTMTFVFATALGTTGFITRQGSVALGASTTLSIISGEVDVRASEGDDFRPVSDGALLRAGMTIRNGADTYAVL